MVGSKARHLHIMMTNDYDDTMAAQTKKQLVTTTHTDYEMLTKSKRRAFSFTLIGTSNVLHSADSER